MTSDERTEDYKTSCQQCIFAQWTDGVQLENPGCDLGRLEKFIAKGKATSHPDGYHIIETVCNTCRGPAWMNNQPLNADLVTLVEEEIKVSVDMILASIDDESEVVEKLLPHRLNECANQKFVTPKQIIVVFKNKEMSSQTIYDILGDCCKKIPYLLVKVIPDHYDFARSLDMAVQHVKARYYCVVQLEHNIPINMLNTLNELINDQLESVSMIYPRYGGYSGLIIQTMLHKIFGGNRVEPIYDKIMEASKLQGKEDFVHTWEDLWIRQKSQS